MTDVPFDIVEANRLCDEYGKRLGVRIEYQYRPDTKNITCPDELRFRFYSPDGRNHGIVFSFSDDVSLAHYMEEAKDGWADWANCNKVAA